MEEILPERVGMTDREAGGTYHMQYDETGNILKEISPGCSLEGLMLKLQLQYFGHLMQRTSFEGHLKRP